MIIINLLDCDSFAFSVAAVNDKKGNIWPLANLVYFAKFHAFFSKQSPP